MKPNLCTWSIVQWIIDIPLLVFFTWGSIIFFFKISARSHLIDSPPTYNVHYGYKSWEAFSNLSYYTRALPPVADDCPTPMGVKGEYKEIETLQVYWRLGVYLEKLTLDCPFI